MMAMILVSASCLLSSAYWPCSVLSMAVLTTLLSLSLNHNMDYFMFYSSSMAWDSSSAPLMLLTSWTMILSILVSLNKESKYKLTALTSIITSLNLILMIAFSSNSMILFYIMFEASLIPIFLIILGWGYQPERILAGSTLLIYMVLASLPLLMSMIFWTNNMNNLFFSLEGLFNNNLDYLTLFLTMAFLVKLPVYSLHSWLPKAHVEAPAAGSMILAAVLLKLGGFGMLRVTLVLPYALNMSILEWAIVGGVMASILCLLQTDLKVLIALSSVSHMSLVASGILSDSSWGVNGAMFIMMGHGFCSSGLFAISGMIYHRSFSRSLAINKGLYLTIPGLIIWLFSLAAMNMSAPPSISLLGEMYVITSMIHYSPQLMPCLALLTFFPAAYSLFLFSSMAYGNNSSLMKFSSTFSLREHLTLSLHIPPLILLTCQTKLIHIFM